MVSPLLILGFLLLLPSGCGTPSSPPQNPPATRQHAEEAFQKLHQEEQRVKRSEEPTTTTSRSSEPPVPTQTAPLEQPVAQPSGSIVQYPESDYLLATGRGDLSKGPLIDPLPEELGDDPLVLVCQHSNLLWAYRNVLIHEFREPGFGFPMDDCASSPYYHPMDFIEGPLAGSVGWEIVIPPAFLENLVKSSLKNLASYLLQEGLNPNSLATVVVLGLVALDDRGKSNHTAVPNSKDGMAIRSIQ